MSCPGTRCDSAAWAVIGAAEAISREMLRGAFPESTAAATLSSKK
ncbi:hypothetical protein ACN6A1_16030 [Myxococcus virescens]